MRIGKATKQALSAARLFRCDEGSREGTAFPFHVAIRLPETHKNPSSSTVYEIYTLCWASRAGDPEEAVIVDSARYFLGSFSRRLEEAGVRFEIAALASPWHIGKVERHGGTWQEMWREVVAAKQVAGRDDALMTPIEINAAKNFTARKAGFSQAQWVLGRGIRLPACLTPTAHFARKAELREACLVALRLLANSDALKRAELRQVRPLRGPHHIGQWVFFYDRQEAGAEGSRDAATNWRGPARVIGHEGRHGIWLAYRWLTVICSPERMTYANNDELRAWRVMAQELEITEPSPIRGGSGFIDIRGKPTPPRDDRQGVVRDDGEGASPPIGTAGKVVAS